MAASDIRREDVLTAIAEYDQLGQEEFLKTRTHNPAKQFRLVRNGRFYDSKAIAGVAHGFATGVFWDKDGLDGGTAPGAAVTILTNLGFFVDDGLLFLIEELKPDRSHGKTAPYQYVVLLWAFARARDNVPRLVQFNDVREELAELLAPFAISTKDPDPAMPWAALGNLQRVWETDRQGLSTVTDSDVKRLNMVGGLLPGPYRTAQETPEFVDVAAEVVARFIGDEPAFPQLLEQLGIVRIPEKEISPEVADATDAVEAIANPRRKFGKRLSAAENKAIEERAVKVVREHFERVLGYATEDVGNARSYDVHATKDDSVIKVEVKGTTSDGAEVVLTRNEVKLHIAEHPNNALAVVRRIVLDSSSDTPVATAGELSLTMPWQLDFDRLEPISYSYRTE